MDYLVKFLNKERAIDVLKNEGINRILKSFKVHHPSMRNLLIRFIERTIDLAFEEIEISKLVNIALCDITSI